MFQSAINYIFICQQDILISSSPHPHHNCLGGLQQYSTKPQQSVPFLMSCHHHHGCPTNEIKTGNRKTKFEFNSRLTMFLHSKLLHTFSSPLYHSNKRHLFPLPTHRGYTNQTQSLVVKQAEEQDRTFIYPFIMQSFPTRETYYISGWSLYTPSPSQPLPPLPRIPFTMM